MLAGELEAYRAAQERTEVKRAARREGERKRAQSAFDAWASKHGALAAALAGQEFGGDFMTDMSWHVLRGEPLTERQTEVAERIMREDAARAEREAAERANAKPVPAGKAIEITGTVVHVRMEDTPFAYDSTVTKMLVTGDGWKIWVTVPAALDNVNATTPGNLCGLRGKVVRFVADVQASRDDPAFGYGKRPRRAEILTAVTA
jgi:hypothetical protein